ncbi:MAG: site-specific DNA-methyltransferase [Neisseriaceae bacterium]|nr:MAG: site-specific DNA-methyltransferase [Neisseriaceae bacterium]
MINDIILGDCVQKLRDYSDNYFDLIIADPPYWKVINEKWDYMHKTEEDYIQWSEIWLSEAYRTLRYGGSMYLFGYFRTLTLLVPHLLKLGFEIRQQIILNKGIQAVAGRATKNYKMFPNVTESILFLIKDNKPYSKTLLKEQQKKLKITSKAINEQLGVKSNGGGMWSIYTGNNVCKQFPTEELWSKLQEILKFNIPYKKVAQTFNAEVGLTDVWDDINFYGEKRYHPTQKPLKLIKRIIRASSNVNDHILDPFAGSGSTMVASLELNRNFTLIELDQDYYTVIQERYNNLSHRASYVSCSNSYGGVSIPQLQI